MKKLRLIISILFIIFTTNSIGMDNPISDQLTTLLNAARGGNINIVREILNRNPRLIKREPESHNVFMEACHNNHWNITKFLVEEFPPLGKGRSRENMVTRDRLQNCLNHINGLEECQGNCQRFKTSTIDLLARNYTIRANNTQFQDTIESINSYLRQAREESKFASIKITGLNQNNIHRLRGINITPADTLDLSHNNLGAEGINLFTQIERNFLRKLTNLNLSNNNLGPEGAQHIANATNLNNLINLNLSNNNLGPEGAQHIANATNLNNLINLNLSNNNIRYKGAEAIAKRLDLPNNSSVSRVRNLSNLDLSHNNIRDRGAKAIANSFYLKNLTILNIRDNNITNVGAESISNSPYLQNLILLDVGGNDNMNNQDVIRYSPYLRNLNLIAAPQ